jgi:hypothetical protein
MLSNYKPLYSVFVNNSQRFRGKVIRHPLIEINFYTYQDATSTLWTSKNCVIVAGYVENILSEKLIM